MHFTLASNEVTNNIPRSLEMAQNEDVSGHRPEVGMSFSDTFKRVVLHSIFEALSVFKQRHCIFLAN